MITPPRLVKAPAGRVMRFLVTDAQKDSAVKIGEVLTLAQAAQLLEIPAAQLLYRFTTPIAPTSVSDVDATIELTLLPD